MSREDILTPIGRLVRGSLYRANDKNAEGKPLTAKDGVTPRVEYYFAIAIPKTPGVTHWSQEQWAAKIAQVGMADFPNAYQSPAFAWKITDGDSQIPNRNGNKPCDREGHPGHWVLGFSGGYKPRVFDARNNLAAVIQEDFVNLGDYIQVSGSVAGNGSAQQPGIFLNHSMVAFQAYGERITTGPDAQSAGFQVGGPLPAGASTMPPANPAFGNMAQNQPAPGGFPGAPAPGGFPAQQQQPAPSFPAPGQPMQQVQPYPGVLNVQGQQPAQAPGFPQQQPAPGFPAPNAGIPSPASMPPSAGLMISPSNQWVPQMDPAKSNGWTYENLIASGQWTAETLRAAGILLN